jgi:hypothetical protein
MADSAKLALIYSKLAELELQKEKQIDITKEIVKKFSHRDLDKDVIGNIETIFFEAAASADVESSLPVSIGSQQIDKLRLLFLAEKQYSENVQRSLSEKLKIIKKNQSNRDVYSSEIYKIREEMLKIEKKTSDFEELCRNLQKLAKEKENHRQLLTESEQSKTEHLQKECMNSIEAVTKKIEEEEKDLERISLENDELKGKLEQFLLHLNLKKEKMKNEEKTKELFLRLKDAKKNQINYLREQERLRAQSCQSKIAHLQETVESLESQLTQFSSKFQEFEQTLQKSSQVIEKMEEREVALKGIADGLLSEQRQLRSRAAEAEIQVIQTMELRKKTEEEIKELKKATEKLEKKCRKVLARRQEVLKEMAEKPASFHAIEANQQTSSTEQSATPIQVIDSRAVDCSSPESVPSGSGISGQDRDKEKKSTPGRRIHHFVLSSSSASSPSRSNPAPVGDGSPVSSPQSAQNKKPSP